MQERRRSELGLEVVGRLRGEPDVAHVQGGRGAVAGDVDHLQRRQDHRRREHRQRDDDAGRLAAAAAPAARRNETRSRWPVARSSRTISPVMRKPETT